MSFDIVGVSFDNDMSLKQIYTWDYFYFASKSDKNSSFFTCDNL